MISIILTCYKGERYIRRALKSIDAQTYNDYEIIVVDEYGKDKTKEIVETCTKKKVRYFLKSDEGPGAAVKYGLNKCSFDLVAIFEQDDYWFETKLEKQLNAFQENPELALVSTDWCFGETIPEKRISTLATYKHTEKGDPFGNLLVANYIVTSSVVLRKSIVEKVGFPDIEKITKGPWDRLLWLRIVNKYPIKVLRDTLVWKYVSPITLFFNNKNYSQLQYYGWLQALSYFTDLKPRYHSLIKHNIALSALQTASYYLSSGELSMYKQFVQEALLYDRGFVRKKKHYYLSLFPNPIISLLKKMKQRAARISN